MSNTLFRINADGHERHAIAATRIVALKHFLDNDCVFADAENIVVEEVKDVVDLTAPNLTQNLPRGTGKTSPLPQSEFDNKVQHARERLLSQDGVVEDPPAAPAEPPAAAGGSVDAGSEEAARGQEESVSREEAMAMLGLTRKNLQNYVNNGKAVKTADGRLTRASIEAIARRRAARTPEQRAQQEENVTRMREARLAEKAPKADTPAKEKRAFDEPKPIVKAGKSEPWRAEFLVGDRYMTIERAATELDTTEEYVRDMKSIGKIGGAPGMVNLTGLQRFMAHPEFNAMMDATEA